MVQKQGLVLFVPAWHGTEGKLEGNAETEAATQLCPVTETSKCTPNWACLYGRKSDFNWIYLVIRNILLSFSGSRSTVQQSSSFSSSSDISKQTKIPLSLQRDSKQFLTRFQFDSVWNINFFLFTIQPFRNYWIMCEFLCNKVTTQQSPPALSAWLNTTPWRYFLLSLQWPGFVCHKTIVEIWLPKTIIKTTKLKTFAFRSVLVKLLFFSWVWAPAPIPAVGKSFPACAHKSLYWPRAAW